MSRRVRIQLLHQSKYDGIILSQSLCQALDLTGQKQLVIQLGQKRISAKLYSVNRPGYTIYIPPSIKKQLYVPFSTTVLAKKEGDILRLGPVVGILSIGIEPESTQQEVGRIAYLRHLLSVQKEEPMYYFVFTPQDVDWTTKTVNALYLLDTSQGRVWRRVRTPLPDVVYNRIPSRSTERLPIVQECKAKLSTMTDAKMFNPHFFDKWSIHQHIADDFLAGPHIPETYHAPSHQTIQQLLQKYGMVYLKPIGGSLGIGIIQITREPNQGYFVRYNNNSQNMAKRYTKLSTLLRIHYPREKWSRYLVQQGISLIRYQGRPFDFRVHTHKNKYNEWIVAAIAAKIAGHGSVTTHVRTGGRVLSGQELLQKVYPDSHEAVEKQICDTTIMLANIIEANMNDHIGEIGFDIGVDVNGHIWMFEANSRPGRSIFKYSKLKEADKHSIQLIVEYCRYLSNFT